MLNVLIACEESQRTTQEMLNAGYNAFSCDVMKCSGGLPERHIHGDVTPIIHGNCDFVTQGGTVHHVDKWDLIIAHPPCTYLTVTGNRWFDVERYGNEAIKRIENRQKAIDFFMMFIENKDCDHIAVENPVGVMSTVYRKPDQYIQPYMFGDRSRKKTGLWLKGLPLLAPTDIVEPVIIQYNNGKGTDNPWHMDTMRLPPAERSRARSITFPGIAKAFVQWARYIERS